MGGLPPLPTDFHATLDGGLAALGLTLDGAARAGIDAHARLLLAWNEAINLTAVRTPDGIALEHVVDSLAAVPVLQRLATRPAAGRRSLLDLGSGGGYPGMPLAATASLGRVALVDSIGKKARFLRAAAGAVTDAMRGAGGDPPRIEAIAERAEDLAQDPAHRDAWDVVVCRAVASYAELVELSMPLLRPGGHLVAWKRDDGSGSLRAELMASGDVARATGAGRPTVERVAIAALEDHRLVVTRKERPTPWRYPRPVSERRRPLLP